jgi:hypothetical protein
LLYLGLDIQLLQRKGASVKNSAPQHPTSAIAQMLIGFCIHYGRWELLSNLLEHEAHFLASVFFEAREFGDCKNFGWRNELDCSSSHWSNELA